jgi:hypothetical protein
MAVAVFGLGVAQFYQAEVGFTRLIRFGQKFDGRALPALRAVPHAVEPGFGYDGQFYAQLALDPLLRSEEIRRALDSPVYRARRILVPWIAHALGASSPWWVLQAYALLNVVCWGILAVMLLRWLPAGQVRTVLAWLACVFSHGLLSSVSLALPDGPGVLLIALGIRAAEKTRPNQAAGILGLSILCRETNVISGVVLLPRRAADNAEIVTTARRSLLMVAPLVLWVVYLWWTGWPPRHTGSRNLALPLSGYFEKTVATLADLYASGWGSFARISVLSQIALTTQAVTLIVRRDWGSLWWRTGVAYLGLMLLLGAAVWEGHPGAVTRVVLPMTIAFNVLLPRSRWFWPLFLLGNASVLDGLETIGVPTWTSAWP